VRASSAIGGRWRVVSAWIALERPAGCRRYEEDGAAKRPAGCRRYKKLPL
jgi:hypothetical protein